MDRKTDYSFIIVNWNSKEFTLNAVDSINSYARLPNINIEIIIVDNGSVDGSHDAFSLRENDNSVEKCLSLKENFGFASACNIGAEIATGEFLIFFNNDAIFCDDSFLRLDVYMKNNPDNIAGVRVLNIDRSLQDSAKGYFPTLQRVFLSYFLPFMGARGKGIFDNSEYDCIKEVDWISGVFICLSKEGFFNIGGFPKNYFMYTEDMEMCYNAKKIDKKIVYLPTVNLIHYRGGSMKKASGKLLLAPLKGLIAFHKRFVSTGPLSSLFFQLLIYSGYFYRSLFFSIIDKEYRLRFFSKISRLLLGNKSCR